MKKLLLTAMLAPSLLSAQTGNIEKAASSDKETNSSITFDAELDGYEVILGEPTVVA